MSWPMASGAAPEPPPARQKGPLVWLPAEPGSYGRRTECGWYSCCKTSDDGQTWVYTVWTREPLTGGMKALTPFFGSFEEARAFAQADADKSGG